MNDGRPDKLGDSLGCGVGWSEDEGCSEGIVEGTIEKLGSKDGAMLGTVLLDGACEGILDGSLDKVGKSLGIELVSSVIRHVSVHLPSLPLGQYPSKQSHFSDAMLNTPLPHASVDGSCDGIPEGTKLLVGKAEIVGLFDGDRDGIVEMDGLVDGCSIMGSSKTISEHEHF